MSTSSSIHICRYCQFTSPKSLEDVCPSCGRILRGPKDPFFTSPVYLYHQRASVLKKINEDKLVVDPQKKNVAASDVQSKLHKWARSCPTEDKVAAVFDAGLIMENIIHTQTPTEDIGKIVSIGKKIGELANALDQYFKAGGSPYDREIRQLRPYLGDPSGREAAASASRDR